MFDHLLESSHPDDSNKWSNIDFGEDDTNGVDWSLFYAHYMDLCFCKEIYYAIIQKEIVDALPSLCEQCRPLMAFPINLDPGPMFTKKLKMRIRIRINFKNCQYLTKYHVNWMKFYHTFRRVKFKGY